MAWRWRCRRRRKVDSGPHDGTPADVAPDVIADDTRVEKIELRPLQVRIPKAVFEEFSERAGREFGFSRGSKKQPFLRVGSIQSAKHASMITFNALYPCPFEKRGWLKSILQPSHEVDPLVQEGDDDRPFFVQPDDVVMFATVNPDAFRQSVERFRPCSPATHGFTTCLDPVEIRLGLIKTHVS